MSFWNKTNSKRYKSRPHFIRIALTKILLHAVKHSVESNCSNLKLEELCIYEFICKIFFNRSGAQMSSIHKKKSWQNTCDNASLTALISGKMFKCSNLRHNAQMLLQYGMSSTALLWDIELNCSVRSILYIVFLFCCTALSL